MALLLTLHTDVHVHLAALPTAGNGVRVSAKMMRSPVLRSVARALGLPLDDPERANQLYLDRLIGELGASTRVGKAVLLGMDGTYDAAGRLDERATDFLIPNDLVFATAVLDRRFLAGVSVNPARRDAVDELERCAAKGAALVKVLPNSQGFDPSETRFLPYYRALARLKLPLLSHVGWEFSIIGKDQSAGDPERLQAPLEAGVTVIAAHGCAQGMFFGDAHFGTMARFVRQYPKFYVDVSALTLPNRSGMLFRLRKHPELFDRLLFGTDFPHPTMAWPLAAAGKFKDYWEVRSVAGRFDRYALLLEKLGIKLTTDFTDIRP